ncbi:MAG: phosphate acyltransferase PlsX [Chloroflexi bacterium]|nr:phosphate acyltransferase PlsX [Chloroflexota bacterium]
MSDQPVALDAMGGDRAPAVTCEGALEAWRRWQIPVTLVGPEQQLLAELRPRGPIPSGISVVHATEAIGMTEHASEAFRRTRDSSMHVACQLVNEGKAYAAVSAGNSGAFFAVAMFTFGRIKGVDRPALATIFPTQGQPALILDVGANAEVRPHHLVQFAVLGTVYAKRVLGVAEPRVGLLSNGEEEEKGTPVVQEAHQKLRKTGLNFVGNVEGKDVPRGAADVVVCDGFAGNVLIKTAEGVAETMLGLIRAELTCSLWTKLLAAGLQPSFRRIRTKLDYAEYGGAPLIGLRHVGIVAHGRSNGWAIANALRVASHAVQERVIEAMTTGVAELGNVTGGQVQDRSAS